MTNTYLIGVDVGTTGTKTAIFDRQGNLVADASEESKLYYPKPGWVEQDPDEMYGAVIRTIRQCLEKSQINPSDIAGIACDGQMAGIGTIDENWDTPTVYDSWLDTRCASYIPHLRKNAEKIISLTGGAPTFSHGAKMLWWMHERPEVFSKIAKFVVPGGYVSGRLAGLKGEQAFIDRTYIHFSCFSDTAAGKWSDALIDLYGLDKSKLPCIVDPWEVIGHISREAAKQSGLVEGTPIAAGCGDTAASMLGAGMTRPGQTFDVAGTASVFAVCLDRFVPDVEHGTLLTGALPIPGLYYALAYINGGGLNLRWFRDELASYEKKNMEAAGEDIYRWLDQKASEIQAGSDKLIFLPHLGGRVCPSVPNARGVFFGLNWSHTKPHLYRAMLEGVAYEYAYYLSIVQSLLPDLVLQETRVLGGGARSKLWNQIKADVLGIPYTKLNREEAGVLGSAILAGYAVGVFDDLAATAERFNQTSSAVEPSAENHMIYQALAKEYVHLMEESQTIFDSLAAIGE